MGRLVDTFKEGAAEVLGYKEEMEMLREANADAQMLARSVEDFDWISLIGGQGNVYFDPRREDRETQNKRAYTYYFLDPIIRRTVDLIGLYTFSEGMPMPRYRAKDNDKEETDAGNECIKRFWKDHENMKGLIGNQSQLEKDRELFLQGNVFLLFAEAEGPGVEGLGGLARETGVERPALRVTDLPEREIRDIITHPGNHKIPIFYKRVWRPTTFDYTAGQYAPVAEEKIVYYRDWRFDAPTMWNGQPYGPDPSQIGEGRVYHLATNKTSDMRFGMSELQSVLKWAQGLNTYMTNRMALVQALAKIAMRAKTKGGAKNVSQMMGQLTKMGDLANQVEGSASLKRTVADSVKTKASVEGGAVDMQPAVTDSNAQGAVNDIQTMKGQIAAGTGLPIHHLGDAGSAGLATATAMDGPLLKLIKARQKMWQDTHKDIVGRNVELEGLDPERVEVTMPPILERDVGILAGYLVSLWSGLDRNASNVPFMRFVLGKVLEAMGEPNPADVVDELIPKGMTSPFQQDAALADAQSGGLSGATEETQGSATAAAAATARQTAERADNAQNMGRHRGGDRAGGPDEAGEQSRQRARRRNADRTMESDAELLEGVQEDIDAELADLLEVNGDGGP